MHSSTTSIIHTEILDKLYVPAYSSTYDRIAVIIQDNIELELNTQDTEVIRYVRFNGEIYFNRNLPDLGDRARAIFNKEVVDRNMYLHPMIREHLLVEIQNIKELAEEQETCSHYLRTILTQCLTLADAKSVIPDAAWALLGVSDLKDTQEDEGLLPEQQQTLIALYEKEANSIKERIFLNVLTRRK